MYIHSLFERTVDENRERVALRQGDKTLTYLELDHLANSMSHYLISKGIRAGDVVGISLPRSFELIAGIIGILKAGAVYLPMDSAYPSDRLQYMKEQSRLKYVLSESVDVGEYSHERPIVDNNLINLAYVIYTSGSTGMPKGVSLSHLSLSNLLHWQNKENGGLRTLQFTPISFDVHFQEIFSTLSSGGELVLVDESVRLNPVELIRVLDEQKVERLFLPFVAFNQMADTALKLNLYPKSLKEVTTAGEQLKITPAIRSFFEKNSETKLHNHYGPSETHVVSSLTLSGPVNSWDELPTIGSPIQNCFFYLLNENKERVSKGSEGELYVGGVSLADGYLHNKLLTEERFIEHKEFGRLYKTGDTCIELENGEFKYLGRKDGQVKIRGYRIEVGEIEVSLSKDPRIEGVAVKVIELNSEKYLCAYFVGEAKEIEARNYLKDILPEYMVPTHFVKLDKLPLTPSGKVNYKELPLPSSKRPELMNDLVLATSELEQRITKVWEAHLGLTGVGVLDSFFDLGGTSLLAIKVVVELNALLNKDISVVHFFQAPTIKQLASKYSDEQEEVNFIKYEKGSLSAPIAIVGMSGLFPEARDIDEFWENLLAKKNSITSFPKNEIDPGVLEDLKQDPHYRFVHGVAPGQREFDHKFFGMTPREAELMDPQQRKFLELAVHALESAGYFGDHDEVIGVFAGMGNSKYSRLVDQYPEKTSSVGEFNVMLGLEKDYIATRLSHKLNLTGPALSIHTGCSTSLVSIIEAVKSIRSGDCTMALAGGISISGAPNAGHLFQEGGILSQDGRCSPFDEKATGTVFTEGGGILVLKRLDKAIESGDNILAVIKGVGVNNDGSDKMSFTAPSIKGQADAIYRAQMDAHVEPSTIKYIEAHGTATPVGDPIEVEALRRVFERSNSDKQFCYLSSVKANIGHLTAAAGVAGVIKTVLVLKNKIVPGTANFSAPNKLLNISDSPFMIPESNTELVSGDLPLRAGVSSFGVGGTNAHIILEEYLSPQRRRKVNVPQLFKLSARTEEQLKVLESSLQEKLKETPASEHGRIAFTLDVGRKVYPCRSYLVSNSSGEISFRGSTKFNKKLPLVMMFPGQGSQYYEMGKTLTQKSLIFRSHFDKAASIYQKVSGEDIVSILNHDNQSLINQTFYTQPALFIIQYALGKTLMDMGIRADAFIGHSVGEYVAATLSEMFSLEDGIKIISKRAKLMNKVESGSMLSVGATLEEVQKHLGKYQLDIAAINGTKSLVVAGTSPEVRAFKEYLESLSIAAIPLKTSHAFHSRMMSTVVEEFKEFISRIDIKAPITPLMPTALNDCPITDPQYWADHIMNTVNFAPEMTKILKQGEAIFVEVGPNHVLTKLSQKIAAEIRVKQNFAPTLSNTTSNEEEAFLNCLGKLWSLDYRLLDSRLLYAREDQRRTLAPLYPFEKSEHWLESRKVKTILKSEPIKIEVTTMAPQKKELFAEKLVELFESSSGIEISEYGNDTCFMEMGMDSLFLTQMAMQLKKEFKIQINFRQLVEEFNSITSLVENFVDQVHIDMPVAVATAPAPVMSSASVESFASEQVQLQQRSAKPLVNSNASDLEQIIQGQLEIMRSQIELLQGSSVRSISTTSTLAATPVPAAVTQVATQEMKSKSRGADIKTAKDSFGAAAKINVEKSTKYTNEQQQNINKFFEDYIAKTRKSKNFTQTYRKPHADPRVVTGFKPENKEIIYPIVVEKSNQQTLWDLDGNTYIDMLCGFGSNFFGNGNERIKKYVLQQIEAGIEIGPQHPLVGEVSELICELTGNDRAAFCNTGSEAVLGAMRVARTVTGREKIVVFSGSYHGINDEVIIRGAKQKPFPAAPGINNAAVSNMIVLEYGTDEALEIIRSMADDLAAVLIEPVQSRRCDFHPVEFLKEVRKITEKSQTCLIFDEVITGFRIHPAGAQGHFGIRADLCTYGKIVGGGMPIGVISGKAEYMDALDGGHWEFGDDSTPTVGVTYFAGTFVRHPLALAAAKGALEILKEGGEGLLNTINNRASKFAKELNQFCKEHKIPLEMHNFGSLMKPKWTSEVLGGELLFALLRFHGVHTYDGFPWFVNMAHTDDELSSVLGAFRKSFNEMQEIGLLEDSVRIIDSKNIFNANFPPRPGAKLGKDERGNPAWYIEDENNPGEYFLVRV